MRPIERYAFTFLETLHKPDFDDELEQTEVSWLIYSYPFILNKFLKKQRHDALPVLWTEVNVVNCSNLFVNHAFPVGREF